MANVIIPQDFTDYLEESGYKKIVDNHNGQLFMKDGSVRIILVDDGFVYEEMNEGDDDHHPYWVQVARFNGLARLNFFGFAMIMNSIGAVSIKDNIRKTSHSKPVPAYPMNPLFQTLERFAV